MSARSALEELDLSSVLAAFLEQSEQYGHTADSDVDRPLHHFRGELIRRAQDLDVILPGDRQRLDIGYKRAAQLAALAIATMRRIRREQAACNTALDPPPCDHIGTVQREVGPRGFGYRCSKCDGFLPDHELRRGPL